MNRKPFVTLGCVTCSFLVVLALPANASPVERVTVVAPSALPTAGGGGDSCLPVISSDGRYVLFASTANNLAKLNGTNYMPAVFPAPFNVFLRDRSNGLVSLVSIDITGTAGGNRDSMPTAISEDGRYLLFESLASNLVLSDTNDAGDIFLRDMLAGTTKLVSANTNGTVGNGPSSSPVMTSDGRYAAFISAANDLVTGDDNQITDVFVRDLQQEATVIASVGARSSRPTFAFSGSDSPLLTPDGRYVCFYSTATNLASGAGLDGEIYVRDLVAGTTTWASRGALDLIRSTFGPTNRATSCSHCVSAEGRFVSYLATPAPRLVSDGSATGLVLRYDLLTGSTKVVNTNGNVSASSSRQIRSLAMTADGRLVTFIANLNDQSGSNTCLMIWDAQNEVTTLVSTDLSNFPAGGRIGGTPGFDSIGRYVTFISNGSNLVTNQTFGEHHLYRHDLTLGTTLLLDADTNGVGWGVSPATTPEISADGRFVTFEAPDGKLVPNDGNRALDVFCADLLTGSVEMISAADSGAQGDAPNGNSYFSSTSTSADGRYVAFVSDADNLVAGDTNGFSDVFVRERMMNTNILVSLSSAGIAANGASTEAAISADGRFVAFTSSADNLAPGDTNRATDVFVRDVLSGTTTLVSVSKNGVTCGDRASSTASISADGRYVLFRSLALNLAPGSFVSQYLPEAGNLFLRDLQSQVTSALTHAPPFTGPICSSTDSSGRFIAFYGSFSTGTKAAIYIWDTQAAGPVFTNQVSAFWLSDLGICANGNRVLYLEANGPTRILHVVDRSLGTDTPVSSVSLPAGQALRFSADGSFLVYATTNAAVSTDTNSCTDIYLYDIQAGTNFLISHRYDLSDSANGASDAPVISQDARFIAYRSLATDLVQGSTQAIPSVFLYDRNQGKNLLVTPTRVSNLNCGNWPSRPFFSPDGKTLFFESWSSEFVPRDFNSRGDLFSVRVLAEANSLYLWLDPRIKWGNTPILSWPLLPGKKYRVQYKDHLGDSDWLDLDAVVTLESVYGHAQDPKPSSTGRYYRVLAY